MPLLTPLYAVKSQAVVTPPPTGVQIIMYELNGYSWSSGIDDGNSGVSFTAFGGGAIIDPDTFNSLIFKGLKYHTGSSLWYAFMFDTSIEDGTVAYSIWTSSDGYSFDKLTQLPALTNFLYNDGNFYTNGDYWLFPIGNGGTPITPTLYKTSDFSSFTDITIPGFYQPTIDQFKKVLEWEPVNNKWIISGNTVYDGSGNIIIGTSSDGEIWSTTTFSTPGPHEYQLVYDVGSFGNTLLASVQAISASGNVRTNYIYSAPLNNSSWTVRRTDTNNANLVVNFANNSDLCIGYGTSTILASRTSSDWTRDEVSNANYIGDYCQSLNLFFTTGNGNIFQYSTDGFTWVAGSDDSANSYNALACKQSIPIVGDNTGDPISCYLPPFYSGIGVFDSNIPTISGLPYSIPNLAPIFGNGTFDAHGYFKLFGDGQVNSGEPGNILFEWNYHNGSICSDPGAFQVSLKCHMSSPCIGDSWMISIITRDEGFNGGGYVPLTGVSFPNYTDSTGWTNYPVVIGNTNIPARIAPSDDATTNCAGSQSGQVNGDPGFCSLPFPLSLVPDSPDFVSFAGGGTWNLIWYELDEFDTPTGNTFSLILTKIYNVSGTVYCNGFSAMGWYAVANWNGEGGYWNGYTSDLNVITCIDGVLTGTIDLIGQNGMSCDNGGTITLTLG